MPSSAPRSSTTGPIGSVTRSGTWPRREYRSAMPDDLSQRLLAAHPELERVREAARAPVYLVGGAVRDLLLGGQRADLDLVVVGDAAALAEAIGADVVAHESFATAKALLDGHEVD